MPWQVLDLGTADYREVWQRQLALVEQRQTGRQRRHADRRRASARVHARPAARVAAERARARRRPGHRDRARRRRHVSRARSARRVPDRPARRDAERDLHKFLRTEEAVIARWPSAWHAQAGQDRRVERRHGAQEARVDGHRVPQVGDVPRPRAERRARPRSFRRDQPVRPRRDRDGLHGGRAGRPVDMAAVKRGVRDAFSDVFARQFD